MLEKIRSVALSLMLFLKVSVSLSQEFDDLKFEHINLEEGLPHSLVTCLIQDHKGFLWIGTENGLSKYDGYVFKTFLPDPYNPDAIHGRAIKLLYQDKSHKIWIEYLGGGVSYYDPETEKFTSFLSKKNDPSSISDNLATCFYQDKAGNFWIGTSNGLNLFQPDKKTFKRFLKSNGGVSDNYIITISEYENHLLVGTKNGLTIIDSFQASKYYFPDPNEIASEKEPISRNHVTAIKPDKEGNLWVGTDGFGLLKFKPEELIYNPQDAKLKRFLSPAGENGDIIIQMLFESKSEDLWVGTNQGAFRFAKGNKEKPEHFLYENKRPGRSFGVKIHQIIEDHQGNIFLCTDSPLYGLAVFHPRTKTLKRYLQNPYDNTSISNNIVSSLLIDSSGCLWVGTIKGGLNKVNLQSKQFYHIKSIPNNPATLNSNDVYSIYQEDNTLWVGTIKGLNKFDLKTGTNKVYDRATTRSMPGEGVGVIQRDSGFFWIGFYDAQFSKFRPETGTFQNYLYDPGSKNKILSWSLRSLYLEKDVLWIGACTAGLAKLQKSSSRVTYFMPNPDDFTVTTPSSSSNISDIKIWCIVNSKVDKDILWIGTESGGLNRFSKKTGKFQNYQFDPHKNSISSNEVFCIHEDQSGMLYLGTGGGGLNVFDPKKEIFSHYLTKDGLPSNSILGILEDKHGNLWMSTDNGISRYSPSDNRFKNYFREDGLQSNEFNNGAFFKNKQGQFYFGGVNGITVFYPDSIKDHPIAPRAVITGLKLFNKAVDPGDTIDGRVILKKSVSELESLELSYNQHDLSIEFSAIHFAAPGRNSFAYKLEGYDRDWKYTDKSSRVATYTNLPFGEYVFKVKAANLDGIWSEEAASVGISIIPAFWQTVWFKVLLVFLVILLLVILLRLRIYQLRKQKILLQKLVKKQTHELEDKNELLESQQSEIIAQRDNLLNQNHVLEKQKMEIQNMAEKIHQNDELKLQFFTNISHEFRTPLTLINGPLERLVSEEKDLKKRETFKLINTNAQRLLKLVNELMDFRKIDTGSMKLQLSFVDIVLFTRSILESFADFAKQHNINISLESQYQNLYASLDQNKLEKVIYNLLSNAFKYSKSNGEIKISILKVRQQIESDVLTLYTQKSLGEEFDFIEVRVEDTGIGISLENIGKIFDRFYQVKNKNLNVPGSGVGLALAKELVELHGGKITVESGLGKGSTFHVYIPQYSTVPEEGKDKLGHHLSLINIESDLKQEQQEEIDSADKETKQVRILIIEDNPEINKYLKEHLENTFVVHSALNGESGLELAFEHIPDLIISDVMMAGIDGFDVCKTLKQDERTSHIPIILLTAKSAEDGKTAGIELGADDYITKPFSLNFLQIRIKNLIDNRRKLKERFSKTISLEPSNVALTSADANFLEKAMAVIENNMKDPDFNVEIFAREMLMSRTLLYLKFKGLTDQSPSDFIRLIRLKKAAKLLVAGSRNVAEISNHVGFRDCSHFTKSFKKQFGVSPSKYTSSFQNDMMEE